MQTRDRVALQRDLSHVTHEAKLILSTVTGSMNGSRILHNDVKTRGALRQKSGTQCVTDSSEMVSNTERKAGGEQSTCEAMAAQQTLVGLV